MLYSHVNCIIDCTEVFIETPFLDIQAKCWSECKHNCTIKFLVSITTNGMISYVSPCYGCRASDKFIFNNCSFFNFIKLHDHVMADTGLKVKVDLVTVQTRLAIPTTIISKLTNKLHQLYVKPPPLQMLDVEHAIGRLRTFRCLKN